MTAGRGREHLQAQDLARHHQQLAVVIRNPAAPIPETRERCAEGTHVTVCAPGPGGDRGLSA